MCKHFRIDWSREGSAALMILVNSNLIHTGYAALIVSAILSSSVFLALVVSVVSKLISYATK
jgi:hypothetical protein